MHSTRTAAAAAVLLVLTSAALAASSVVEPVSMTGSSADLSTCATSHGEVNCEAQNATGAAAYTADLDSIEDIHVPVHMAVLVYEGSPFLEYVLSSLEQQHYVKDALTITLLLAPGMDWHLNHQLASSWQSDHSNKYAAIHVHSPASLHDAVVELVESHDSAQHLLLMDSRSRLTNPDTLKHLISLDKPAVAPMLVRQGKWWSNFWDAASQFHDVSPADFSPANVGYVRSNRYLDIVDRKQTGVFIVPLAFGCLLVRPDTIPAMKRALSAMPNTANAEWVFHLTLAYYLHQQQVPIAVSNLLEYGHLINPTGFDSTKAHPDLFLVEENPAEWADKYLNELYWSFEEHGLIPNCTDVFKVPMFSPAFARNLIEECEHFGQWSNGDNKDERIQGGYEPVPTQDIHFNQIGFNNAWRFILRRFLRPVTSHYYTGYTLEGRTTLDFVVRYRPDKQNYLRPHHDASTVTLNVALNQGGVDYQGGGTRFIRQNCTLINTPPGWGTLSPGRLTHLHEGLKTTAGTRYILVSFIDQ
ncbi:PLOD2 protein [Salpingoeca rosetta]|uniref:PLOD2 protein n=1 Tax=Salpingoeca rosetta (strain ATCC 50818 / BSB-021) TaxID=946362 RepID=F2TVL0_SALR5|nr:PLOD2 protein [Salpingoeca rosetta]EGD72106.1 PLOD2 protein [Salpingoeca rosetta]|eukprot:XP_004998678.1 PLOD2 protein [Salpingoeca rosetta]